MLGLSDGIGELGGVQTGLVVSLLIAWLVVGAALIKGVKSSGKVRCRLTVSLGDAQLGGFARVDSTLFVFFFLVSFFV